MDNHSNDHPSTLRGLTPSPEFVDRIHGNDSPEPSDTTVINSPRIPDTMLPTTPSSPFNPPAITYADSTFRLDPPATTDSVRSSSPVNSVEAFAESRRVRDRANTIDTIDTIDDSHSDQIDDALNRTMSRATRRMSYSTTAQGAPINNPANTSGGLAGPDTLANNEDLEKRITEETYPDGAGLVFGHDDEKDGAAAAGEGKGRQFGWVDVHYLEEFVADRTRRRSRRRSYLSDVDLDTEADLKAGTNVPGVAEIHKSRSRDRDTITTEKKIDTAQTRFTFFSSEAQTTIHSTGIGGLVRPGESFRDLFSLSPDGGVWWLDVVNPDKGELDAIAKAFSIHPLTAEDIMTQENREKVELFKNYYFVCFRTFSSHTVSANYDTSNDIDSIISVNRRAGTNNTGNHTAASRRALNTGNHSPTSSSSTSTAADQIQNQNTGSNGPNGSNAGTGTGTGMGTGNAGEETKELLEPLNIYMVVFRGGILTFSFEPHTHAKNVRRRIGRLRDFVSLSSDWVCYAMIDDIVDSFGPVMRDIETESETIEDQVFTARIEDFALFLSQIGNLRKKVMGMMRLLGGKADVIRGFAKRCNEEYNVTPHGDIGLYLGDIQDHVVTMTTNLAHLEKMLSRSHGNYLASLSVKNIMVGNHVNRALTKITFIATILVPLNMISSLFGMNVKVPGQEVESTQWFWGIVGLILGIICLSTFLARKFKLI